MKRHSNWTFGMVAIAIAVTLAPVISTAQDSAAVSDEEATALAKKTQNPVGDLISLPFQNNTSFGMGPNNRTQNVLNIQPVVPVKVSSRWSLISRTILPVISQPDLTSSVGSTSGIGDLNTSWFLSPADPGKLIWGVGPIVVIPTATDDVLGSGKWSIGPSLVALTMKGPWVAGFVTSNIWSVAGDSNRPDVNSFLFQYFINFNMAGGWYLTSAPIITANWEAPDGEQWIVPFGAGAGKIFKIGNRPMNAQVQAFYNVETPTLGPAWTLRVQLQLLFPK